MFYKTTNLTNRPLDIKVNQNNFNKYDSKPLRILVPRIWKCLSKKITEETDHNNFKNHVDAWFRVKCQCNFCSYLN